MKSRDHMSPIAEHAKSEGVFTTVQATRLDTPPRDALPDVASSNSKFDCARLQEMLVGKYDEAGCRSCRATAPPAPLKSSAPA